MFDAIRMEVGNGVATITFDRPEQGNAMDLEVMQDLMHAAIFCDRSPQVRAVLITGSGRFFCAGGDLDSFGEAEDPAALIKEMTVHFHAAVSHFNRMDAPVIAAVNGMAAGAGFSLAASCDISLAAASARFASQYTAAALSPDGSSTFFLPRLVGMRRAAELILTNRMLSAEEAVEWGLVTRVVEDDRLAEESRELAERLAAGPTLAYGAAKRLLLESFSSTLETQMEKEARSIGDMSVTADGREGVLAFMEKRRPRFTGA